MKLCYLDLEATGTDCKIHETVQISFILENPKTGKTFSFSSNVRPFNYKNLDIYQDEAMKVNSLKIEDIKNYPEPEIVYDRIISIFNRCVDKFNSKDKMFFIGYKANYDYDFMRSFFERNNDSYFGSYFWNPPIDVMQKFVLNTMDIRPEIPNMKLKTVCKLMGINVDENKLHDSLYDIQLTRELYKILDEPQK